MGFTGTEYPNPHAPSSAKKRQAQIVSRLSPEVLRRLVSSAMVAVHLISPELADSHVSQMNGAELLRRLGMYTGAVMFGEGEKSFVEETNGAEASRAAEVVPWSRRTDANKQSIQQPASLEKWKTSRAPSPERHTRRVARLCLADRLSDGDLHGAGMNTAPIQPEAPSESHGVRSHCTLCDGSGWRPVQARSGDRLVTRCKCRQRFVLVPLLDYKSAAAGER